MPEGLGQRARSPSSALKASEEMGLFRDLSLCVWAQPTAETPRTVSCPAWPDLCPAGPGGLTARASVTCLTDETNSELIR